MDVVRGAAPTTFAELLKQYRETAGLTQEALAERAGLSARTISDLERGLKHTPRHETLDLLATALALAPKQLATFRALGRAQETLPGSTATVQPVTREPATAPRNPYKGLRAFRSPDVGDFFGRESLIASLLRTLSTVQSSQARFLALLGPSGSGKSSVVMAGLIPRLQHGALPGSETWLCLEPLLPGAHPLEALTLALSPAFPDRSLSSIRADLDDSARGLHVLARRIAMAAHPRVVLVIDQAEELFTLTGDESERRHFIDLLLTAISEPAGPFLAIWTMRADFYDRPMSYPALGALLETHSKSVLPMSPAELRQAIERPAALPDVGLTFEDDLVGDLLFEVHGQAGALPLLAFTLDQLYERRESRCLTLAAYHALGGVQGALARHAEATYASLPSYEHQRMARALFLRLIDPGATEQETTRRRAALDELRLPDAEQTARMRQTADAFIAARLLVTSSAAPGRTASGEGSGTIEVSHEALIREWARLGEWLREAREDVHVQHRLSEDATEWLRRERPVDNLYRGLVLDTALASADRNTPSAVEREFLTAGLDERHRQEAAEQERHAQRLALAQQVAAANRRAADRLRYLAAVLAAALIVAMGLTALALKYAHDAGVARTAAEIDGIQTLSRQLAAQATNHLGDQYDLALLLSVQADQIADTFEARDSLLRGLAYNPRLLTYLHQGAAGETIVAFSPDGRIMASGGCGRLNAQNLCRQGEIRLWDVARRHLLGPPLTVEGGAVYSLSFSPDGKTLAAGAFDGSLRLWDVQHLRLLGGPIRNRANRCFGVVFSPDDVNLACADFESVAFWSLPNHRIEGPLLLTDGTAVPSMIFSRNGRLFAAGANDGSVQLWDMQGRQSMMLPSSDASGSVYSLAFSPNGALLASGGLDGTIQLWDTTHLRLLHPLRTGSSSQVNALAFDPTGAILAIGSADGMIRLWDVPHRQWLESPLADGEAGSVSSVVFSPDGRTLVSANDDGSILLWDITRTQSLGSDLPGHTAGVNSLAFSRNGQMLAFGNDDGSIHLWNVPSGHAIASLLVPHTGYRVLSLAFDPNRGILAAGNDYGTIQLWDTRRRRALGPPLTGHAGTVTGVAFSPDGRLLASGSADKTIRLWRVADGREIDLRVTGHIYGVTGIAFSPDGRLLASVGYDGSIQLWSVPRLRPLGPPFGHTQAILSLAFSPDGRILATGNQDGTIWFWNVTSRQALGEPLTGHTDGVTSLAFSPDGSILASAGEDQTVRFWDTVRHQALGVPLTWHSASVTSVAFSPDGKRLATGAQDGTVRITNMDRTAWLDQACRTANRDFTAREWQQYLGTRPYHRTCSAGV
jgi:WD40 repeat protein/transcriptional regulator with XRE-family HTH domain